MVYEKIIYKSPEFNKKIRQLKTLGFTIIKTTTEQDGSKYFPILWLKKFLNTITLPTILYIEQYQNTALIYYDTTNIKKAITDIFQVIVNMAKKQTEANERIDTKTSKIHISAIHDIERFKLTKLGRDNYNIETEYEEEILKNLIIQVGEVNKYQGKDKEYPRAIHLIGEDLKEILERQNNKTYQLFKKIDKCSLKLGIEQLDNIHLGYPIGFSQNYEKVMEMVKND